MSNLEAPGPWPEPPSRGISWPEPPSRGISIPVQVNIDQPMVERLIAQAVKRQRIKLAIVALLGVFAGFVLSGCNLQRCSEGAVCSAGNTGPSGLPSPSPSASPTPSPSPSPTVKPESCAIEYMVLQPRDGLTLVKDQSGRVSLTPYQTVVNPDGTVAQREVSEACNLPRIPAILWTSSSAAVMIGTGFEPIVTRVGVGIAQITATLEGKVSNAVVVR